MASSIRFMAKDDVVDCDIGGDRALLHVENNSYFTINSTGAALWEAMAQPRTLDELVAVVVEKFDVTAEQCRDDIQAMLTQMNDAQIIQTSTDG